MLKITKIRQAGEDAALYYTEGKEHYYTKSKELPGIWYGGSSLGLVGEVNFSDFKNILQGKDKNGNALVQGAGEKHRPGWDLTFSAPKSVSLYYVAANNETKAKIDQIWYESINKTLNFMQDVYMDDSVRRGKGGHTKESPKELIFAKFDHCNSRANDPQIHTHVVMANIALRHDGTYGTIEPDRIYKAMKELGAIQRAEFIQKLQNELGLEIERDKESFRIKDFSKEIELEYSKRSIEIEKKIREENATTGAHKDYIKTITREKKSNLSREENISNWKSELKEKGIDETFAEGIKDKYRSNFIKNFKENIKNPTKEDIVKKSIEKLTQNFSTVSATQLRREIAIESQCYYGIEEINSIFKELDSKIYNSVVYLGNDISNQKRYTTKEIQQLELEMIKIAESIDKEKHISIPNEISKKEIEKIIDGKRLYEEQKKMVEYVLSDGNLKIVQGAAGAGKSFSLERVKDILENRGYKVVGLAPTGIASENLNDNKINTVTLDKYFFDKSHHIESIKIDQNTVVIVDEAGMVGSRKMHALLKEVLSLNAKLILVGDSEQLQSIDFGGAFQALKNKFGFIEMVDSTRQRVKWQKNAANFIRNGKVFEAISLYGANNNLVVKKDHSDIKHKLVEDYIHDTKTSPNKSEIILSFYNKDTLHINSLIHDEFKKEGKLNNSTTFKLENRDKKIVEREFSVGERIVFLKNDRKFNVKNGSLGTILEINNNLFSKNIKVLLDNKNIVEINTEKYKSIDYGYAITIHKSQGTTFDNAKVLVTENVDKKLFYVLATRHRENLNLYVSQESFPNIEMTNHHGKEEVAEIVHELSKTTSRTSIKDTSLDYNNLTENLSSKSSNIYISNNFKTNWHDNAIENLKNESDINKKFDLLYEIATKDSGSDNKFLSLHNIKTEYQKKAEDIIINKKITDKDIQYLEVYIKKSNTGIATIQTKQIIKEKNIRNTNIKVSLEKAKIYNEEFVTKKIKNLSKSIKKDINKISDKDLIKFALEVATTPRAVDAKYRSQNWSKTSFQSEAERIIKNRDLDRNVFIKLAEMIESKKVGLESTNEKYFEANMKFNSFLRKSAEWLEKSEERNTSYVTKNQRRIASILNSSRKISEVEKIKALSEFLKEPRATGNKFKEFNFQQSKVYKKASHMLFNFKGSVPQNELQEFTKEILTSKVGLRVENNKIIENHKKYFEKSIKPRVERILQLIQEKIPKSNLSSKLERPSINNYRSKNAPRIDQNSIEY